MSQLEALFAGKTVVDALSLFLLNSDREFYQSEVAKQTDQGLLNVQKALERIEKAGFVTRRKQGRMVYYRANRSHPAFEDLKRLFIKTVAIGQVLQTALQDVSSRVEVAFIFGSYARGEESAESDIDLFILGDFTLKELSGILSPVSDQLNREINPVNYSKAEFQKRHRDNNRFIQELLSCPKIWLIGSQDELEEVVE